MASEPKHISSTDFGKDVDRYIEEANTANQIFEVQSQSPHAQTVVVLSKQEFEGWRETMHLLSGGTAESLLRSIAELNERQKSG